MMLTQDGYNPDLLERMPLGARLVLDVGCGSGALGAAYKLRNPRAIYLGIDADPEAATLAGTRLDRVALGDVEANPLPFPVSGGIDCLIYGDILEHLRDPGAVLRAQVAALAPGGVVLACLPNAEHWSFVARLLDGSWDYEEEGLFDYGHLRWFTKRGTERMLRGAGLLPADIRARVFDAEQQRAFVAALAPALPAIGVDPADLAGRSAALQYVWRATRAPLERMVVVGRMLDPQGGVSDVRTIQPLAALASDPAVHSIVIGETEPLPRIEPGMPKILVLQRQIIGGPDGAALLRRWIAEGWLIVTEFDDHPAFFPMLRGDDIHSFTGVHAVQTSTDFLATTLSQSNPEVAVFANALHTLPPVRNFAHSGHLTLFFGAFNRQHDWAPYLEALNAAAHAARGRLRFMIVHDRALYDALDTPHKRFAPKCDYETYLDLLGQCEISFMPLQQTDFNRAKSDLKFIEAAGSRVVALAAPLVYGATIENGRTGLLFGDADELRMHLMRLVSAPELGRQIGDAARAYAATNRMLAYQVEARIAWYRGLWARRAELTAQIHARVPDIA